MARAGRAEPARLSSARQFGQAGQLGSAQLTNLRFVFSLARLSSRFFNGQLSSFYELENEPTERAQLAHFKCQTSVLH